MATPITQDLIVSKLPARPSDGHKGTFGHLFIVAGSRGFTGAAKLVALAAGRSGVGLVTLGVPESLQDGVAAGLLESMTRALPDTGKGALSEFAVHTALEFAEDKSAVILGPGIGQHGETRGFVRDFTSACPMPLLIDADGLNCMQASTNILRERSQPTLLTPHPGEMARLTGTTTKEVQLQRETTARELAEKLQCTVVLKGAETLIADEHGECYVNTTGNSGLAKGGTGDVLSGLAGGLLAQGVSPSDAALVAVYLHGLAGDLAAKALSERGMVAGDVIEYLPHAWRRLEGSEA